MAGLADYIKVAQQGYKINPPDAGKMFTDAARGYGLAKDVDERKTLVDIGREYQEGGVDAARDRAYGLGKIDVGSQLGTEGRARQATGIALSQEDRAKVADAMKQTAELGKMAETQNDQQWGQTLQMYRSRGVNVPAQFEGPQGRLLAISQSKLAIDGVRAEIAQKYGAANASNASAESSRATAAKTAEETRLMPETRASEAGLRSAQANQANATAAQTVAQTAAYPDESQARIGAQRANAEATRATAEATAAQARNRSPEERASQAALYGLQPGSRDYQTYVLTGALPGRTAEVDATTKKEIQETDDFISQTRSAISSLGRALELNSQAYSGAGADIRSGVVSNTLGAVRPQPGAIATGELANVVTNQALASLRATFGGNPTEGERKILMDVAGSVNQPAALRQKIYERALELANNRLRMNEEKARSLRAGSYYSPGGQPASLSGAPQATAAPTGSPSSAAEAISQARDAISRGAPREAVIQRLRQRGVDPAGL